MIIFTSINHINSRDRTLLEQIYFEYRHMLFNVAYKVLKDPDLAEDAVHSVFVKLAFKADKIDDIFSKKTKGFLVVITFSMLLCSAGGSVSASDVVRVKEGANEVYNPRWSMIISVTNTLEINSNGNASMAAYIAGRSGQVSSIRIISTLQRDQSGSL